MKVVDKLHQHIVGSLLTCAQMRLRYCGYAMFFSEDDPCFTALILYVANVALNESIKPNFQIGLLNHQTALRSFEM